MPSLIRFITLTLSALFLALPAHAATGSIDLTNSTVGGIALTIFVFAYILVMGEEKLNLRKSKPVLVAAGIIWSLIGWVYVSEGMSAESEHAFRQTLLEFAELMLFLLVAMTYINATLHGQVATFGLVDAERAALLAREHWALSRDQIESFVMPEGLETEPGDRLGAALA